MMADVDKTIALIQQISAGRSIEMAEKTCSFSEAMSLLKGSLAGLGLERTGIAIACCGGTRERSGLIARKLVAGGFGRAVNPADRSVRYETGDGWFSWDTVAEGEDMINLFYSLGTDDRPIDYLVEEAGTCPGESQGDFQEKAVPGDCAGVGIQTVRAGGQRFNQNLKGGLDYHEETGNSSRGHRLVNGRSDMREDRPVNRRDKATTGCLFGGAGSDEQGPEDTPAVSRAEAAPVGRGGGGHGLLYPAAAGARPVQAGKTGRQAAGGENSRVKARRRLF